MITDFKNFSNLSFKVLGGTNDYLVFRNNKIMEIVSWIAKDSKRVQKSALKLGLLFAEMKEDFEENNNSYCELIPSSSSLNLYADFMGESCLIFP